MARKNIIVRLTPNLLPYFLMLVTLLTLLAVTTSSLRIAGLSVCGIGSPCDLEGGLNSLVVSFANRAPEIISALSWPIIFATTALAWWRYRETPEIVRPLYLALPFVGFQTFLSSLTRTFHNQLGLETVNLGLLLILQAIFIAVTINTFRRDLVTTKVRTRAYQTPLARQAILAMAAVFLVMVSGAVVTMTQAQSVCFAWPLCPGGIIPSDPLGWVQLFHRLFVGLSAVVITKTTWVVWQTQREHVLLLVSATAATMLFYAQGFIGALQVTRSDPAFLGSLHSITTAVMWAMLTLMVVSVGFLSATQSRVSVSPLSAPERKQRRRDFLALTKPIVVLLLLMTTYGGMVVSGKAWPSLSLTGWTLLGGALAAGGSSAINQYIDRNRDRLMVRTAKRPIAAGRLTPAEGLAFGVALCLISFYLLAGIVNLTAAFLAVVGMVYYVVLYSILLKNATVQNIVIGGGAGAIPPLVGWAAVSGGISVAAFTLFVVIFFWTPPHFWALALVRRKDYQRAGVPMLPVVRGERETRLQIFLYTLGLVAITLTLPFFGVGNAIYWVSAAILGLALIHVAWKVWQRGGNKLAWKMYRYSSMYLAFLFLALMIDAVL